MRKNAWWTINHWLAVNGQLSASRFPQDKSAVETGPSAEKKTTHNTLSTILLNIETHSDQPSSRFAKHCSLKATTWQCIANNNWQIDELFVSQAVLCSLRFIGPALFLILSLRLTSTESSSELELCVGAGSSLSLLVRPSGGSSISRPILTARGSAASLSPFTLLWSGPGRLRSRLSFERSRDDLRGQMKVVAEVLDSFVCQVPVIMTPRELLRYVTLRLERLKSLDNVQIRNFDLWMFGSVEVFLRNKDSLLEQMFVNDHTGLLWHQHLGWSLRTPCIITTSNIYNYDSFRLFPGKKWIFWD